MPIRHGADFSRPWTREQAVLIGLVWLASLGYTCSMTVADPDLWGHTLYGMRAIEQGVLVERTDSFSYTAPGARWINHEWLTEYQYGWLWQRFGGAGLWWWRSVMAACVFGVGGRALYRARVSLGAALLLLTFSALCLDAFFIFVRPQLATFALFALSLAILRSHWDRPESKWIWTLPLLSGLWANLHGGFLAGLAIQAAFFCGFIVRSWFNISDRPARWTLGAVCLLSAAATLVNPYGIELHRMLWSHLIPEQAVREWQPLWAARQMPLYYVPFGLAAAALLGSRRWQWIDLLVIGCVAFQAASHIRHVGLLAIAVLVLLPGPLCECLSRPFQRLARQFSAQHHWRRWAATAGVVSLLVGLALPGWFDLGRQGLWPWQIAVETTRDAPGVPRQAMTVIRNEGLHGNLLTEYGWGQYVLWHLHPQIRVAFDGRYRTVYPDHLERDFLQFQRLDEAGPGHTPMLDDYDTEIALLPTDSRTRRYLDSRQDWVAIFADDQATLYVRAIPKFDAFIERSRRGLIRESQVPRWMLFPDGTDHHSVVETANQTTALVHASSR